MGESSAFFTYVKSNTPKSTNRGSSSAHENAPHHETIVQNRAVVSGQAGPDARGKINREFMENIPQADDYGRSNSIPGSFSMEGSSTPPTSMDISQAHLRSVNDPNDIAGYYTHTPYPYYIPGVMNQLPMLPPSKHQNDHTNSAMMPQYNHMPQYPHHIPSYPYYPFGICLQPGQVPASHPCSSLGNPSNERKLTKDDRRSVALMKFRQKRKERCFDKKIRYVNRKKLAERRPRMRGQFVRKVNGVSVDLNGEPASGEEDEDDEDYEDEYQSNLDFSPDDDGSVGQK